LRGENAELHLARLHGLNGDSSEEQDYTITQIRAVLVGGLVLREESADCTAFIRVIGVIRGICSLGEILAKISKSRSDLLEIRRQVLQS
jgi:hypothetical protein